ncbi:MAG: phenylacetate--CoA ligase family protein [Proteobacteria bacterium]|nr:phenylacetate--CoA ligase family protein [Pseudomonadota bacterium]
MPLPRRLIIDALLRLSGSRIIDNLREIHQIEHMSRGELEAYQRNKLRRLLIHAHHNVPYYRRILSDCGVVSEDKVRLEKLDQVPILTRDLLRSEFSSLTSADASKRRSYTNSTGGSSGSPVRIVQDAEYKDWNIANKIYYKTFAGQRIGDRELRLWGSDRDLLQGKGDPQTRITNYLYNRKELNAFKLSKQNLMPFVQTWNSYRPQWVEAYAQVIFEFSKMVDDAGINLYRPRGVLTSAGTLYPAMKETLERVLGCQVYNRYGSREAGDMACSCGHDERLHLSPWNHYIEILDAKQNPLSSNKDQLGKIYVTTLNNYSMPLIRYDIGDIAALAPEDNCSCGRTTPLLRSVEGREMSVFKTKDGRYIPPEFFIHFIGVVFNDGGIERFQVVQKKIDEIELKVVVKDEQSFKKTQADVEGIIRKTMGECEINWTHVPTIPCLPSGKYLYTVSEVDTF